MERIGRNIRLDVEYKVNWKKIDIYIESMIIAMFWLLWRFTIVTVDLSDCLADGYYNCLIARFHRESKKRQRVVHDDDGEVESKKKRKSTPIEKIVTEKKKKRKSK